MYGRSEVGCRCHWCGEFVPGKPPATGNHVFCKNGGKCKMAHARAYNAYEEHRRRVTPGSGPGDRIEELPAGKGNAKRPRHASSSSAAIPVTAARRSNARKGPRR